MRTFQVTHKAKRPASKRDVCFYCQQPIGAMHKPDCVLINKKVTIKVSMELEIEVPAHWSGHDVEFHRNESSSCADNTLQDCIKEIKRLKKAHGCMCGNLHVEYIGNQSEPFLDE